MSHISKLSVKTKLQDREILKNALQNLAQSTGVNIQENTKIQRAINKYELEEAEVVDYLVNFGNGFEIGLKKQGNEFVPNEFVLIADEWYWNAHGKNLKKELSKIEDFYLFEEIKTKAEEEGYTVDWTYNNKEEEIEFEMSKW